MLNRRLGPVGIRRCIRSARSIGSPLLLLGDGTFLRSSNATHFSGNSSMSLVGDNVLRLENKGDGLGSMYLLEGAATNLFSYSHELDQWALTNSPVITTGQSDPIGGTQSDIAEDDTAVLKWLSPASWSNQVGQFTFWVKKDAVSSVYPEWSLVVATAMQMNTATGATAFRVGGGGHDLNVEDRGDWWRVVWHTGTELTSRTDHFPAASSSLGGARDATQTRSVESWGYQFEGRAFPTSYMPTSGSAGTRAADFLTFASGDWPTELSDGVWEFDFAPEWANDELADAVVLSFGGSSNEMRYQSSTSRMNIVIGGAVVANPIITFSRDQKMTFKYNFPSRELTVSGAATGDGVYAMSGVAEWPTGVTLRVGGRQGGNFEAYGRFSPEFRAV